MVKIVKKEILKEYFKAAKVDAARSGRSVPSIMADMYYARKNYGTIVRDYFVYGFSMIGRQYFQDYVSSHVMFRINRLVNDRKAENKWFTYLRFKPYFKRETVNLDESSDAEIKGFLSRHESFFAKGLCSYGGNQVEYISQSDFDSAELMLSELKKKKLIMLEEEIRQHEAVNMITDKSVNTLRIVSARNSDGEVGFMLPILRVGGGKSKIDNVTQGGMYTLINPDNGKVCMPGYFQENVDLMEGKNPIVEKHPESGFFPMDHKIPYIKESFEMIREMARLLPEIPLAGWDIAISAEGPKLVEVNDSPGLDMNQNYYFTKALNVPSVGAKAMLEERLGLKIEKINVSRAEG